MASPGSQLTAPAHEALAQSPLQYLPGCPPSPGLQAFAPPPMVPSQTLAPQMLQERTATVAITPWGGAQPSNNQSKQRLAEYETLLLGARAEDANEGKRPLQCDDEAPWRSSRRRKRICGSQFA